MGMYAGRVGCYMMMMFYVDDLWRFMLDLGLNDVIMMHMWYNHDIYVRSMIYDDYSMMNMWTTWWTPAVHVKILMI